MLNCGKRNVLGVRVDAVDYEAAVNTIVDAARSRRPLSVTALAVHGLMTATLDDEHLYRLNRFDLVLPDGQPVRWALNCLHRVGLTDRVYGPTLSLKLCEQASQYGVPVYFYGSTQNVLDRLVSNLTRHYPRLLIVGAEPSLFRRLSDDEREKVVAHIRAADPGFVFVGLGCPRQEIWIYENRDAIGVPLIAVGAAFDFHAGNLPQAPVWMQCSGLEWLFRLIQEPRRLWRRYLFLNPLYVTLLAMQWFGVRNFDPDAGIKPTIMANFG